VKILALLVVWAAALSVWLARAGFRGRRAAATGGAPSRPSRVLIVGATGGTGRQLVAQALERGYEVTALVRDPTKLDTVHPSLRIVKGDVRDPASCADAVRGTEAVVCALGHRGYWSPARTLSRGTANLLDAMRREGSRRFVCETSLGLGDSVLRLGPLYTLFVIPVVLPVYFLDKARQERVVASSAVEWVIVRPGILNDGPKRGRVRHGTDVGSVWGMTRVSRADVAAFMLDQLESDAYLGRAPGVAW
jgi:putative NADH-flavin reductase